MTREQIVGLAGLGMILLAAIVLSLIFTDNADLAVQVLGGVGTAALIAAAFWFFG